MLEHTGLGDGTTYEQYLQKNAASINRHPRTNLYSDYGAPLHAPDKLPENRKIPMFNINSDIKLYIDDAKCHIKNSIHILALDVLRQQHFTPAPVIDVGIKHIIFHPETLTEYYIYRCYLSGRYKTKYSYSELEKQWFPNIESYSISEQSGQVVLRAPGDVMFVLDILDWTE